MKRSNLIMAAVFVVAGTLGATAWADQSPTGQALGANCTVAGHRVVSVTPSVQEVPNGKRTNHLLGANIRIMAEPGMTAEYLTVQLQRHIAGMSSAYPMADCVFGVASARFEVHSVGDGFVFQVTSDDLGQAKEILRRARLLG